MPMNEENKQPEQTPDVPNEEPVNETPAVSHSPETGKKGSGWQMPEPKFQQTSGYLPQGYINEINEAGGFSPKPGIKSVAPKTGKTQPPDQLPEDFDDVPAPPGVQSVEAEADLPDLTMYNVGTPTVPAASAEPEMPEPMPVEATADVEPQPDITEVLEAGSSGIQASTPAPVKSGGILKTILLVLFFFGLGILALVVIAIAYYLFLAESTVNRNF